MHSLECISLSLWRTGGPPASQSSDLGRNTTYISTIAPTKRCGQETLDFFKTLPFKWECSLGTAPPYQRFDMAGMPGMPPPPPPLPGGKGWLGSLRGVLKKTISGALSSGAGTAAALGAYTAIVPSPSEQDYTRATMISPKIQDDSHSFMNLNFNGGTTFVIIAVVAIIVSVAISMCFSNCCCGCNGRQR